MERYNRSIRIIDEHYKDKQICLLNNISIDELSLLRGSTVGLRGGQLYFGIIRSNDGTDDYVPVCVKYILVRDINLINEIANTHFISDVLLKRIKDHLKLLIILQFFINLKNVQIF